MPSYSDALTGAPRAGISISRRELFLWLSAILLAGQLMRIAGDFPLRGIAALEDLIATKSVFYYLAWYAVFRLLLDSRDARTCDSRDLVVGLAVVLVNLFHTHAATWIALTATGLYLSATRSGDGKFGGAAVVMLALALNGFWGRQIFDLFAYQIVRADAAALGTLLTMIGSDITWQDTIIGRTGAPGIIVYGPCSAFHNLSLGLLCWVTVTKLVRTEWLRKDFLVAGLVCLTVVLLNTGRLALLVVRPEEFDYWHTGFGAVLVGWVTSLAVLAISVWGAISASRVRSA